MHRDNEKIDAGLKENYRIEEAIEALQKKVAMKCWHILLRLFVEQ